MSHAFNVHKETQELEQEDHCHIRKLLFSPAQGRRLHNSLALISLREALFRNGALLEGSHHCGSLSPEKKQEANMPAFRPRLRVAIINRARLGLD